MGPGLYGPQRFEASSASLHVTATGETRTQSPGSELQPVNDPGAHVDPVADSGTFFQRHPKANLPGWLESYSDGLLAGEVRIGCIGAGSFSTGVIFPALQALNDVRFEAVASSSGVSAASARKAFRFARAETPAELLDDPNLDAVFVLSRHDSHARYVIRALQRGKAVFVEKPLAATPEELAEIERTVALRQSSGAAPFVMVGFNRRFAPLTERVQEFYAGRSEAMMLNIRINAGFIAADHWVHRHGGRIVGELCHFVDWARAVVGHPIVNVSAAALPNARRYQDDNLTTTLTFADGSLATIQYLANGDRSIAKEFYEVFCGGAVARLDNFCSLELARGGRVRKLKATSDKGHRRELELTLEAVRTGEQAPIPFDELVEVTNATFLVQQAVRRCSGMVKAAGD